MPEKKSVDNNLLFTVRSSLRAGMFRFGLVIATLALFVSEPVVAAYLLPPADLASAVAALRHGACGTYISDLRARSEASSPAGARAGYLLAHCLEQAGHTADAKMAFETVTGGYPPLASYARFHAARLAVLLGDDVGGIARLHELPAQRPAPPLAHRVILLRAEALVRLSRAGEARDALREIVRDALDDMSTAEAWWLLGRAAQQMGDRHLAAHAYGMAWWAVPHNPHAADAVQQLRDLLGGHTPTPPPAARFQRARRLLARGQRNDAERELAAAVHGTLSPNDAAQAWYELGLLRLGTAGAVYAFEQAARDPKGAARAAYWLGSALSVLGRAAEAKQVRLRFTREYPASPWTARSLLALAYSAEASREWAEADRLLSDIATRFPGSWSGDEARWRRGRLRYQLGQYAGAETLFIDSAHDFPSSPRAAASLYWAAKTRLRQGKDARPLLERAADRYPLTYYGQRARSRLGRPAPVRLPAPIPAALPDDRFGATHEELAGLGFDEEAAGEAQMLSEQDPQPDTLRILAMLRARIGDVAASVAAGRHAIAPALHGGATLDAGLWMLAYPRGDWEMVATAAQTHGVDPYLILAVIREESRFDPAAVSIAGAVGLMQVLPATARGIAGTPITPEGLMDPQVNIRLGVAYLAGLLRRFQGDVVLAVAAYNAGPGVVRRFARLPFDDVDVLIESIPLAETRVYVQRVLESYGIYRWLYR